MRCSIVFVLMLGAVTSSLAALNWRALELDELGGPTAPMQVVVAEGESACELLAGIAGRFDCEAATLPSRERLVELVALALENAGLEPADTVAQVAAVRLGDERSERLVVHLIAEELTARHALEWHRVPVLIIDAGAQLQTWVVDPRTLSAARL